MLSVPDYVRIAMDVADNSGSYCFCRNSVPMKRFTPSMPLADVNFVDKANREGDKKEAGCKGELQVQERRVRSGTYANFHFVYMPLLLVLFQLVIFLSTFSKGFDIVVDISRAVPRRED